MLDLLDYSDRWPDELAPENFRTDEKEPFDLWCRRVQPQLGHLHPMVLEQWVYRHWKGSPYIALDLSKLIWRRETWPAEKILTDVFVPYGPMQRDPERDYRTFTRVYPGKAPSPTRLDLDKGTWTYPIIVLETPAGLACEKGDFPDIRFALVEGHQRFHYFNALYHRGEISGGHELFVLTFEEGAL